jgi:prepilin-type processing-associated H-X9-DG protein
MDLFEGISGNDFSGVLEESRHDSLGPDTETGGSNYAFSDGSARYMKVHTSLYPLNLWAVSDTNRVKYADNVN